MRRLLLAVGFSLVLGTIWVGSPRRFWGVTASAERADVPTTRHVWPASTSHGRAGLVVEPQPFALRDALVPPIQLPVWATEPDRRAHSEDSGPGIPGLLDHLAFDEFSHDDRATFHPHGKQVCASGCAVSNHPTGKLTPSLLQELLDQFASEPLDENSFALESLLFYGRQTRQMIGSEGAGSLDAARAALLRRELARTHARISIRVVDEHGGVRASLPPTRVPFDRRHVFEMDVNDVQPLVTSGTVKRVGLKHLWIRL